MYGNYQYSLDSADQSSIQIWLRLLPKKYHTPEWELLHQLTYADSWTQEPKFEVAQEKQL